MAGRNRGPSRPTPIAPPPGAEQAASKVFQAHLGVVLACVGGVTVSVTILLLSAYFCARKRRLKRQAVEERAARREKRNGTVFAMAEQLTSVRTDGSGQSGNTDDPECFGPQSPKRFGGLDNNYSLIGFGNCNAECLESIAGDLSQGGRVLPGDVALPDAVFAQGVRDARTELTPPTTPDKSKLPAIEHWYRPVQPDKMLSLHIGSPMLARNQTASEIEPRVFRPLHTQVHHQPVDKNKALPLRPLSRGQGRRSRYGLFNPRTFSGYNASIGKRERLKGGLLGYERCNNRQGNTRHSRLRRFGDVGSHKESRRAWIERNRDELLSQLDGEEYSPDSTVYETINPYLDPDRGLGLCNPIECEGDNEGYRASLISAYRRGPGDNEGGLQGSSELYLWKPLPRPPVEKVWTESGVATI
ncbi:hypothetical protein ABW19_dt0208743 [Dactylella cylindrospora]|nr:hypothetical protein ABW19_dt0208743 [Dactylella cylindrospora]